ncbi:hypothetical protein [Methylobacterium sp. ID0610]
MSLQHDPSAPVHPHPTEPSPGLVVIILCATLILATLAFLLR